MFGIFSFTLQFLIRVIDAESTDFFQLKISSLLVKTKTLIDFKNFLMNDLFFCINI